MPNETDVDVELTELGQLVWNAQQQGDAALERLLAMAHPRTQMTRAFRILRSQLAAYL
jgi:hypothetical protein